MPDKIILTNVAQLKKKYGSGYSTIKAAIAALIAADKQRNLQTVLIDMMSPATATAYGKSVANALDPKQNKSTVDAIYKKDRPDYLMILGAWDVVPHQPLTNPINADSDHDPDDDRFVPSDLPYACDHPYSRDPGDFLAVTRVVGRLPDLVGGSDPAYLETLLTAAAAYQPRPAADYQDYLGLSAHVWSASTQLSLTNIFGHASLLCTSPSQGPAYNASQWATRAHFINCHGAPAVHQFFGEDAAGAMPVSHDAGLFGKKVAPGTVASAECCYGAELYAPNGSSMGICNTYLIEGAHGFFGSTNIAYGPAVGNSAADFVCQDFLWHAINGASLGRATLEARQSFVRKNIMADPVNLKTLAQFLLLGDPSIHPVKAAAAGPSALVSKGKKWVTAGPNGSARGARRMRAHTTGAAIGATAAKPRLESKAPPSAEIKGALAEALARAGATMGAIMSMAVDIPMQAFAVTGLTQKAFKAEAPTQVHVAVGPLESSPAARDHNIRRLVAVVALQSEGKMDLKTYFSR